MNAQTLADGFSAALTIIFAIEADIGSVGAEWCRDHVSEHGCAAGLADEAAYVLDFCCGNEETPLKCVTMMARLAMGSR